jgi:hypothetical protein
MDSKQEIVYDIGGSEDLKKAWTATITAIPLRFRRFRAILRPYCTCLISTCDDRHSRTLPVHA